MKLELPLSELRALVSRQIDNLFTLGAEEKDVLSQGVDAALERSAFCFAHTQNKYYSKDGVPYFNPFHSGQYSIFLYFLSNSIFTKYPAFSTLADRVYYLNKALNGFDLLYTVRMPRIFMLDHPVGSVMGAAEYGDYFMFSQNCTVGNNKGIYPRIGQNVKMMSGAKILGDCKIGDGVIISANTYVKDTDVPPRSLVFGTSPHLIIKSRAADDV